MNWTKIYSKLNSIEKLETNLRCFFCFFLFSVIPVLLVGGQQQKFRVMPRDLQVLEGSEALLRCEIHSLAGAVQWTKDGFALGKFGKLVLWLLV